MTKTIAATAAVLAVVVVGATALGGTMAFAHGTAAAFYGGQVAEVDAAWRVEFAVRDGLIRAWVRDHADAPVPPARAAGKAVLVSGGARHTVTLAGDGDSLVGSAPVKAADALAAVLSLTIDGKPVSARFSQEAVVIPSSLPAPAVAGREAFARVCAACHGEALRGSDQGPPLLHPYYAPGGGHGDDIILKAIGGGAVSHHWKFGDMPKPEGVTAAEAPAVLAYVRALQAANGIAPAAMDHGSGSGHEGHAAQ